MVRYTYPIRKNPFKATVMLSPAKVVSELSTLTSISLNFLNIGEEYE